MKKEEYTITFPWIPDSVTAYKFGICILCEKLDKPIEDCPHCKRVIKCFQWSKHLPEFEV